MQLAIPVQGASILSYSINLVGLAFIGRLGAARLGEAMLAMSFYNVSGMAVVVGFSGVLETTCGQAYGAGAYRAVGLAYQRGVLLALMLCALVLASWTLIEPLMLLAGQQPNMAHAAARFLRLASPALVFASQVGLCSRYLNAQGYPGASTTAALAAVPVAPLANWLLITRMGLGLDGAALALVVVHGTYLAVLAGLTHRHHLATARTGKLTWHGWHADALRGWGPSFRLGVPSMLMGFAEWAAFEACVIMAGWLPRPEISLGVMGLTMTVATALYMIPGGFSTAASIRVSNALGANLPRAAPLAAAAAFASGACIQMCTASGVFFFAPFLARVFSHDPEVVAATAPLLRFVAVAVLPDGMNAVSGGIMRGAGRPDVGAVANLVAFWMLGLPLAYHLAFTKHWEVAGLWMGLLSGSILQAVVLCTFLLRLDWRVEAQRAARLNSQHAAALREVLPALGSVEAEAEAARVARNSGAGSSSSGQARGGNIQLPESPSETTALLQGQRP